MTRNIAVNHASTLSPLSARRSGPLQGRVRLPGDKSISQRALILGAMAVGETRITGMLEGEDALSTANAMRALGALVERTGEQAWRIMGVGVGGFSQCAVAAARRAPGGRPRCLRRGRHRRLCGLPRPDGGAR